MALDAAAHKGQPLAGRQDLPLSRHGTRRVLVTAPRQYASKLCSKLVEAGARPVWLPGVEIRSLQAEEDPRCELDTALQSLSSYNLLAFTSKNGIHAVMQGLAMLHGGQQQAAEHVRASAVQLCALGADGQVLREEYGLQVDVSPPEASTSGLVRELRRRGAKGARVLCPVPLVKGGLVEPPVVPRFLEGLQRIGALPQRVPAYATVPGVEGPEQCEGERLLLEAGLMHAIAFTSTAEAQGLCIALGGAAILRELVLRHKVLLAAHGPYTAAGVAEVVGLSVPCVSQNFSSFDGLITALQEAQG